MQPDDQQKPPEPEALEPAQPQELQHEAEVQRPSREDALAEMRRTLREEETKEESGFRALVRRIFRRRRRAPEPEVEAPSRLDFPEPPPTSRQPKPEPQPEPAPESVTQAEAVAPSEAARKAESAPDFEAMVRTRLTGAFAEPEVREPQPVVEDNYAAPAPGHSILTTLRQDEATPTETEPVNIRQEALEDYVSEPEEPEPQPGAPTVRNLKRSWRYMRPIEKRLLIMALVIIGLAGLGASGFLIVKSIPTPTPVITPTTSVLPIPISISLPGGWVFPLRTGSVQDGKWNPTSPEWLGGTEVCRWVSLPWTVQLEAVLRTLKANDEIKLSMSNYDSIVYKVQAIEEVPASDISKLATDSPCLLVILSKEGTGTRWVVVAQP